MIPDSAQRPARARLEAIVARARGCPPLRTAIVHPVDAMDLAAVREAAGLMHAVLIGPKRELEAAAADGGFGSEVTFVEAPDGRAAARIAVELAAAGRLDALMKGSIHTDDFMSPILAEPALRTARRMSHVALVDTPAVPRLVFISDGAINIAPSLDVKRDITQNAIDVARAAGLETPRVAILAAVETVSSRLPATVDAACLAKMADRGQLAGGLVDGPLALDDALVPEAARRKGIVSQVAGCADVLIAPDLDAANLLFKEIEYLAAGSCADVVAGASIPIVLTSRADDAFTRVASIALATLLAQPRA